MKLLICTGIYPPAIGGPATYTKALATALQERGHRVRVITYVHATLPAGSDLFPVVRIKQSRIRLWHYCKYFLAAIWYGQKAELLYAQDPVSAGYPASWAARILGKPLILKITGDYSWEQAVGRNLTELLIEDFQNLQTLPVPIRRIRKIQIAVCREAAVIVTPSAYLKRLVQGWGIVPDRIRVIYNAVEPPRLRGGRQQIRQELGIKSREFLVLSAGRPVKWKGFAALEAAVADLQKQIPAIKLEILNNVSRETIWRYLSAGDVFVLNTGYEGFSHIAIEALAAGIPAAISNVGGNPEIVRDKENGLLFEYNNQAELRAAILKLYEEPALREKFIQAGKETVKKFGFEEMISKTEELLQICGS